MLEDGVIDCTLSRFTATGVLSLTVALVFAVLAEVRLRESLAGCTLLRGISFTASLCSCSSSLGLFHVVPLPLEFRGLISSATLQSSEQHVNQPRTVFESNKPVRLLTDVTHLCLSLDRIWHRPVCSVRAELANVNMCNNGAVRDTRGGDGNLESKCHICSTSHA